jgi:hypothetical protein
MRLTSLAGNSKWWKTSHALSPLTESAHGTLEVRQRRVAGVVRWLEYNVARTNRLGIVDVLSES